jgi:hypothetical protein
LNSIDDAVDGISAREAEVLIAKLQKRLSKCAICGTDGADACKIVTRTKAKATIMICPACFELHRLPDSRSNG